MFVCVCVKMKGAEVHYPATYSTNVYIYIVSWFYTMYVMQMQFHVFWGFLLFGATIFPRIHIVPTKKNTSKHEDLSIDEHHEETTKAAEAGRVE